MASWQFRNMIAVGLLLATTVPLAANAAEKVLFEDGHIRFVEVINRPGETQVAAVPFSSVVMSDAAWPTGAEQLGPADKSASALPPGNQPFPFCYTQGPSSAATVNVKGDFPQHYYRIDYKRVDGKGYAANWRAWYSDVFGAPTKVVADPGMAYAKGKPFSKAWPFDFHYNATTSAPANHTLRYQDSHIDLLEVAIRPGETEHMHGHPYASVYADDGGFQPDGAVYNNATLIPGAGPPWGKMSGPPTGPNFPICFSAVPEGPHQVSVVSGPPQHFYRVQFKRIDGEAIKANWKQWYPAK